MKCLNCNAEMVNNQVVTKRHRISYDMCEKCGSLWLDAGELDKMAFKVNGSLEACERVKDAEPERQPKKCPRCVDFALEKVKFLESDDVHLHYCRNCGGFWLDGGELDLIDKELAKIMPVGGRGFSDFVNNTHVPYWYKRVKKRSSETDFRVEVPPIQGARLVKGTSDRCPACNVDLNLYSVFSMELEGCPKCHGVWLVKDELRKLKNRVDGGSLRWLNDEIDTLEKTSVIATRRACVHCKTVKMVSVIFGKTSIVVDWCPQCHGMWLDKGEFDAITDYLKRELEAMPPHEIEAQVAKDVKRIWSGGPESRLEELIDAKAAVSALINATIFEHPALYKLCTSFLTG